ncbi:MAG: ABC transporter ATP-binding protein [Deltaproteobacteria bacterium]|nr:ABC transporter ATP-binding protein [Deltaproteobacteria bacterium]MBW2445135.1 ABC transporter ATP-binding protein [Deltaproteobacteria bacterium]
MAILEARNVTKVYETRGVETPALRGVDLEVEAGEFSALAGPSGSGKTTLLNLFGALDEPTTGSVILEGQCLGELSAMELADLRLHKLGFVFQAYNLIPVLTARENVEFVMELQGVKPRERQERAEKLLAEVGLADLGAKRPLEMSGGQQQRVAVARAIASGPRIVLADEPTANLDSKTAGQLLDLMHTMNRERGVTFLFSTHDPMVIDKASRVVRLVDGRISADERR